MQCIAYRCQGQTTPVWRTVIETQPSPMYDLRHSQNPFTSSTSSSTPWLSRHQKRSHTLTPTPSSLFSPVSMINLLHLWQSKASSFFFYLQISHICLNYHFPSSFWSTHHPTLHNPLSFHPLTVIPMYYTVSIKHHANSAKLSFPHARTNFDNFWQRAFSKHSSWKAREH